MVAARIAAITQAIISRSDTTRKEYLERLDAAAEAGPRRGAHACGNIAHAFAASPADDKARQHGTAVPNLAIVTAYNDMLSAHQPYESYPALIREAARAAGGTAQVAGGVPAMCDGVTQGRPGMELSLFSRDVIAMATGVALSHDMFDAAVYLGICDKIVPGLVIGALAFGHLPAVFIPAGPMTSGISNDEKARIRNLYAEGKIGRAELLESESRSYHGPGTCTFYGTANSNQMLMEVMGLHLPGAAFVNPGTRLREELTKAAVRQALSITALGNRFTPVGRMLDERAFVNAIVALHATGGSTNHAIHLLAMARAGGIVLTWDDISDLSEAVPLLARVYPNGAADVNRFTALGGTGFVIGELLDHGLLHDDVRTVMGDGLAPYRAEARLEGDMLAWSPAPAESADTGVLRPVAAPFAADGGLRILRGNLGSAVIKISAVKPEHRLVRAPARVFDSQEALEAAFKAGAITGDMVAVIRFQGPKANGMPELHKLTPLLSVLMARGHQVALVTDGRMSGASGKVPAAIHVTPECVDGGPLARVRDGDIITVDAVGGVLSVEVSDEELAGRSLATLAPSANAHGTGRELFALFRSTVGRADAGASVFGW
jgi:phosphogluconate dehydratase